jgi:lipopolysaccharide/colanic/teichoic acid biosynthesis glycosyltransferase
VSSFPVFPVVFDTSPSYLGGPPTSGSLLLTPIGTGTLLCRLHARFAVLGRYRLTIAPSFRPDAAYVSALHGACTAVDRIVAPGDFESFIASLEPSDWLLFIDPTCVPLDSVDPEGILAKATDSPRSAVHLVALDSNVGGTCEWVDVDGNGDVTRIQRYYDDVTWSYTSGVAASLVPASCLRLLRGAPIKSLRDLRAQLAANGVPARDVPVAGRTFNLQHERELLMLTERLVRNSASADDQAVTRYIGEGARVAPSARLLGPVVVQKDATIETNAVIVGPTVVGAGATIGADAIVVQCVVQSGAAVPARSAVRHRLVADNSDREHLEPAAAGVYDPQAVPAFRADVHDGPLRHPVYPALKLAVESAIAFVALLFLLPLLAAVAILIKLDSRGPVLFADRREARGGRTFRCFKFRTMVTGADAMQRELMSNNSVDGPQFKMRRDPRLTGIGRWLRAYSIDELPQLLNVLVGQMSLVGPRPSPFRENQTCVPWREGRLSVRPGITGLWQVCRHNREEGDFHQWIEYDLLYVRHMSALLDLKIIAATIFTLGGKGCVPLRWMIPVHQPSER